MLLVAAYIFIEVPEDDLIFSQRLMVHVFVAKPVCRKVINNNNNNNGDLHEKSVFLSRFRCSNTRWTVCVYGTGSSWMFT